jgi:hypothetical protein
MSARSVPKFDGDCVTIWQALAAVWGGVAAPEVWFAGSAPAAFPTGSGYVHRRQRPGRQWFELMLMPVNHRMAKIKIRISYQD